MVMVVSPLVTFPNSVWVTSHKNKPNHEFLGQVELNFPLIPDESILND